MNYADLEDYVCPICKKKGNMQTNYTSDYMYLFCNNCRLEFSSGVVDDTYANGKRLSEKAFMHHFYKHHFDRGADE